MVDKNPWLLYWLGVGKSLIDPHESAALFEEAYRRFNATGDIVGLALSWSGVMDAIFHAYLDLRGMDPWICEFDNKLAERVPALPPEISTRVILSLFVALSFRQPQHPDIQHWIERVHVILRSRQDFGLRPLFRLHLALHRIWQGELAEAEVLLGIFQRANESEPAGQPLDVVVGHLSEATYALHAGLEERCLRAVSEGLAAAKRFGIVIFDSIMLGHAAAICLNRGKLTRADDFLRPFEAMLEQSPFVDSSYYYALAAWRQLHAGRQELALQLFERASVSVETKGVLYFIAAFHLGFGLVFYLCNKRQEALNHLQLGREMGKSIKNQLIECEFHAHSATDSTLIRPPIPATSGH